jgi:hypothetical protein
MTIMRWAWSTAAADEHGRPRDPSFSRRDTGTGRGLVGSAM